MLTELHQMQVITAVAQELMAPSFLVHCFLSSLNPFGASNPMMTVECIAQRCFNFALFSSP